MLEGRILTIFIMVAVFAVAVGLAFTYAPDARFLPLVIGIPGLVLSLVQFIKELREPSEPVVTSEEHRREGAMFIWFIIFVGGLVLFGFLYAGPALVAGGFPSQSEAESWLGEEWRLLADAGVEPLRQRLDEAGDRSTARGIGDFAGLGALAAIGDVVADGVVEQREDKRRQSEADAPGTLQHATHEAARTDRPGLHRE